MVAVHAGDAHTAAAQMVVDAHETDDHDDDDHVAVAHDGHDYDRDCRDLVVEETVGKLVVGIVTERPADCID